MGAGEQGEAAGQENSSESHQQQEGREELPLHAGAVDDAAVDLGDATEGNVTSQSGGNRPTEDVASRGHGRHAPLSRTVVGETGAAGRKPKYYYCFAFFV